MKKILKRLIVAITLLIAIAMAFIYVNILIYAKTSVPLKSDAIVVLGCQVQGSVPSLCLQSRLEKAFELYKKGYGNYIIVSGGKGKDEELSEASVMSKYLTSKGVPASKIIIEDRSTDTYENLKYSKGIIDKNKFKSVVIVSNDFHIYRSLRLAKIIGLNASGAPAPTVDYLVFHYHCREILSVAKSYVLY